MNVQDLFERRNEWYLTPSSTVRGGATMGLVIGLITLVYGFSFSPAGAPRVWGSILLSLFFFYSIALGGVAFSAMQDVIGAIWARPIKRIHEGFGAFLPVASVLFLVFFVCISFNFLGAADVYSWIENPELVAHFPGKNIWLQKNPMLIRDAAAVIIILALTTWQMSMNIRRDRAFVNGQKDEANRLAKKALEKLRYWSAPLLVIYALCYSLLGFDLLMSLAPTWFSTLWAGWLFAILMQTLMAMTLLFMFAFKATPVGHVYKQAQFHDIGKLMHGFTVFFAYLTYAHVLTYWYGNVPEETEYYIHRLHGAWLWLVLLIPLFAFAIPFFALIFKAAKWTAAVTIPLSLIILVSQWFTYVLIVVPQIGAGTHWVEPYLDFGIGAGFIGLFLLCYFAFAKRNPMLAVADALLPEALHSDH